jgi:hypothetical protein
MRHARLAASVFLALGVTMATGTYAQTKSSNCGHSTPAEAGGGNGGKQPQYAEAGAGNRGATKPAEAGGGNGGKQPQYAQAGTGNSGTTEPAESGGGNGGPPPWKNAAAGPCP